MSNHLEPPFHTPSRHSLDTQFLNQTFSKHNHFLAQLREICQKFQKNSDLQLKFASNFSLQAFKIINIFSSLDLKNQFFSPTPNLVTTVHMPKWYKGAKL